MSDLEILSSSEEFFEQTVETFELRPTQSETGQRLDRFLATRFSGLSRNFLQRIIATGGVLVDGISRKQTFKVTAGQTVSITMPEIETPEIRPQPIPLMVMFEDRDIVVIDKPAGMVVHPAPGHPDGTIVNAILHHYPEIAINGSSRPGIVHRLDMDTSGLLVVAKTPAGQQSLLSQWADGSVEKGYVGLVKGVVEPEEGTIDAPIGRDPVDRLRMAVVASGKPAVTHFSVNTRFPETTLLDLQIETGRTHQIRVHLAFIGHPIVGDTTYGRSSGSTDGLVYGRHFLHANRLALQRTNGERIALKSALPDDLQQELTGLQQSVAGAA